MSGPTPDQFNLVIILSHGSPRWSFMGRSSDRRHTSMEDPTARSCTRFVERDVLLGRQPKQASR
jgi:hypothetical protein